MRITLPVDEDSTDMLPGRVNDGNEESNSVDRNEAEEVVAPGNFDPSMELSSKYLICPTIPNTVPTIPPGPYDEDIGDCALRGKSAEIEAWLTALEQIAASCHANRETNWADTQVARAYLDAKIDEFEVIEVVVTVTPQTDGEDSLLASLSKEIEGICPIYGTMESLESLGSYPPSTHLYTYLLKIIGEEVGEYCTMIDNLVKPVWQACDEINFYQDCQAPNPDQYHSIINSMMNAAQVNYDYTNFFYTHTLQTYGTGNFRIYFNESSIDCPIDPQAPNTKFTFSMNTFCREGPSSEYGKVATFLEGQDVQIEGRNHHEPRWWLVPNPGARGQCWVSDSTGSAEGPLEELAIVAPPPLVIKPNDNQTKTKTCSADLSAAACVAAGGIMIGGVTGASSCACP